MLRHHTRNVSGYCMRNLLLILFVVILYGCMNENSTLNLDENNFKYIVPIHDSISISISEKFVQFSDSTMRNSDGSVGWDTREIIINNRSESKLLVHLINENIDLIASYRSKYYSISKKMSVQNFYENWRIDSTSYKIESHTTDTLRIMDPFKDADSVLLELDIYNEKIEKIELNQTILTRDRFK